jgi:hypothetical protein
MRVGVADGFDADLVATERAMHVLEAGLTRIRNGLDPDEQGRFENALLNVAVSRAADKLGFSFTATVLWRMADSMATGRIPEHDAPIELTHLHG